MTELIEAGLIVTVIGMGVVFVLLTLLVGIINAMSRLSAWIEGPPPTPAAPAGYAGAASGDEAERDLASIVTAAVAKYRRGKRVE